MSCWVPMVLSLALSVVGFLLVSSLGVWFLYVDFFVLCWVFDFIC